MKTKREVDYKVHRSRWPFWVLLVVLVLILVLFVFLTLDATGHFGCLLVCNKAQPIDKVIFVPVNERNEKGLSRKENVSSRADDPAINVKTSATQMMTISGEIHFPQGKVPDSLPSPSYLEVEFEDVSMMDAPKTVLGKQTIELKNYKKGEKITYSISAEKPRDLHDFYSVSAVLNVGWKTSGDEWIRRGDFQTDTVHDVKLEKAKDQYKRDIELVLYN